MRLSKALLYLSASFFQFGLEFLYRHPNHTTLWGCCRKRLLLIGTTVSRRCCARLARSLP